jgi:hypothetical protein
MTTNVAISHAEKGGRGRYWAHTEAGEAELTYSLTDQRRMVIGSTFVPREARGLGVALALVKRAVADAEKQGRLIDPVCPYVDRIFDRHPEWKSLRAS